MTVWQPIRFGYSIARRDHPPDAAAASRDLVRTGWATAVGGPDDVPAWLWAQPANDFGWKLRPQPSNGPAAAAGVPAFCVKGVSYQPETSLFAFLVRLGFIPEVSS